MLSNKRKVALPSRAKLYPNDNLVFCFFELSSFKLSCLRFIAINDGLYRTGGASDFERFLSICQIHLPSLVSFGMSRRFVSLPSPVDELSNSSTKKKLEIFYCSMMSSQH